MAKERIPIPPAEAAALMFASDQTCCVCRLASKNVQLHHVDSDPSNNSPENLAVLCLECHSAAHTTNAFARNLSPQLIHLYNESWREIVRLRITPQATSVGSAELGAEAFLEASLDAHAWKVHFMSLAAHPLPDSGEGEILDVWELMERYWVPTYSPEEYNRYAPLFVAGVYRLRQRLDRVSELFADVLPYDFRASLVRVNRQLEVEQTAYINLPQFFNLSLIPSSAWNAYYQFRFIEIIRMLRDISNDSDRRRERLMGDSAR